MFHIVLIHPQIPHNCGAIGRLCVNTETTLHLVKPLGFSISDKQLKRAGLDYWHKLNPTLWENESQFFNRIDINLCYFATTKTNRPYFKQPFHVGNYLIFGSETQGLSSKILTLKPSHNITIPMSNHGRSLNLSMSAAIILYEAIRQNTT